MGKQLKQTSYGECLLLDILNWPLTFLHDTSLEQYEPLLGRMFPCRKDGTNPMDNNLVERSVMLSQKRENVSSSSATMKVPRCLMGNRVLSAHCIYAVSQSWPFGETTSDTRLSDWMPTRTLASCEYIKSINQHWTTTETNVLRRVHIVGRSNLTTNSFTL